MIHLIIFVKKSKNKKKNKTKKKQKQKKQKQKTKKNTFVIRYKKVKNAYAAIETTSYQY